MGTGQATSSSQAPVQLAEPPDTRAVGSCPQDSELGRGRATVPPQSPSRPKDPFRTAGPFCEVQNEAARPEQTQQATHPSLPGTCPRRPLALTPPSSVTAPSPLSSSGPWTSTSCSPGPPRGQPLRDSPASAQQHMPGTAGKARAWLCPHGSQDTHLHVQGSHKGVELHLQRAAAHAHGCLEDLAQALLGAGKRHQE